MDKFRKFLNFIYFYRKRIAISSVTCTSYFGICHYTIQSQNEKFRLAIAGSLANLIVESSFHFADTVNVKTKVSEKNTSSINMVKKIFAKEGVYGFSKGFSATFYGSIVCGFIYFSLYKELKENVSL